MKVRRSLTYSPRLRLVLLANAEALLDRVLKVKKISQRSELKEREKETNLVRSRERSKDQLTRPRRPRVHRNVVALRNDLNALLKVRKVEFGRDTLGVHVQRERDEVDVSGSLSVSEEATLDTVGSREETELGGGNTGSTVVVGVEGDDDVLAVDDVAAEVLDL
jgi:hypothetical protein